MRLDDAPDGPFAGFIIRQQTREHGIIELRPKMVAWTKYVFRIFSNRVHCDENVTFLNANIILPGGRQWEQAEKPYELCVLSGCWFEADVTMTVMNLNIHRFDDWKSPNEVGMIHLWELRERFPGGDPHYQIWPPTQTAKQEILRLAQDNEPDPDAITRAHDPSQFLAP